MFHNFDPRHVTHLQFGEEQMAGQGSLCVWYVELAEYPIYPLLNPCMTFSPKLTIVLLSLHCHGGSSSAEQIALIALILLGLQKCPPTFSFHCRDYLELFLFCCVSLPLCFFAHFFFGGGLFFPLPWKQCMRGQILWERHINQIP